MQKGKINRQDETQNQPELKVIHVSTDQSNIEMEIEHHVKSIRTLIRRLRPSERQKYYSGLLSHILCEKVEYPLQTVHTSSTKVEKQTDFSSLSSEHLILVRELSNKMEHMYRTLDADPS